jgi:hypothetical protein
MKMPGNTRIKTIFLVAILCCFSIHTYSANNILSYHMEFSAVNESAGGIFIPAIDPSSDDQIIQTDEIGSFAERRHQLPIHQNCSMILNVFLSVWLPPKIL